MKLLYSVMVGGRERQTDGNQIANNPLDLEKMYHIEKQQIDFLFNRSISCEMSHEASG